MKGYSIAIIFIVGLALGIAGMFYGPKYLGEYLPGMGSFGMGSGKPVEGKVVGKLHRADKLLITVSTPEGASLVTFNQKVDEISLLVDEGDYITLRMGQYNPFVTNPAIVRVRKEAPAFSGTMAPSAIQPSQPNAPAAPKNEEPAPQTSDKNPEINKTNPEGATPQSQGGDTPQESPAKQEKQKI